MALTGALDVLVTAELVKSDIDYDFVVVSLDGNKVVSDLGLEITADLPLDSLSEKDFDYIFLCGGFRLELRSSSTLRNKLKAADHAGCILGGLWNGAYFIAEAGLLNGYECAFHPDGRAMMAEEFPDVGISQRNHVIDRDRVSCAGANSSLDMMLSIINADCEKGVVSAVEEILSCDKMAEVVDVSAMGIDRDMTLPQSLKSALELMRHNIDEPLTIEDLAAFVNISRRQLERLFFKHLDATPSRYYLELRLTRARQLLQQTNKSLTDIAVATGFVSISHFRRCFGRLFGISPGRFRKGHREVR